MGVTRYVLSSAILGLFWTGLLKGVLTNSTSRCDYPPCSCDLYGRLTCDCKEEGEVGIRRARVLSFRTRRVRPEISRFRDKGVLSVLFLAGLTAWLLFNPERVIRDSRVDSLRTYL